MCYLFSDFPYESQGGKRKIREKNIMPLKKRMCRNNFDNDWLFLANATLRISNSPRIIRAVLLFLTGTAVSEIEARTISAVCR